MERKKGKAKQIKYKTTKYYFLKIILFGFKF